jgi:hypothetical protein
LPSNDNKKKKIKKISHSNKSNLPKYSQLDEASPQTIESSHSCSTALVWSNMLDEMLGEKPFRFKFQSKATIP